MTIRRITALLLALTLAALLAACGTAPAPAVSADTAEAGNEGNGPAADAGEVLILYFCADNTKDPDAVSAATPQKDGQASVEWMANIIHETLGGDMIPIIPSEDYPLDYDELADYAKQEKADGGRPAFEELGVDPADYDTVFIGYPIWWYTVPMILETFFDTYDLSGVTVIPFNMHAGSGDGGTYRLIGEREPGATVLEGLPLRMDDGKDPDPAAVTDWLRQLGLA